MKNVIITGTSRGIGYELALQFADAGQDRREQRSRPEVPSQLCRGCAG